MKLLIFISLVIGAACTTTPSIRLQKDIVTEWNPSQRIINGRTCDRREVPYQVSILHTIIPPFPAFLGTHTCGGILITTKHVLTAGHCKHSSGYYKAVLGQHSQIEISKDKQQIDVKDFIVHKDYKGGVGPYDIGILILKKEAKLSAAIKLIQLPSSASDCDGLTEALLSGWGKTSSINPLLPDILRCAELPIIDNEKCASDLTAIIGSSGPLDDTMICTGTNIGRDPQSSCNGDSGGPLAIRFNNIVIGIVSWGINPCGTTGAPSVYTKVCSYLDWINEVISKY